MIFNSTAYMLLVPCDLLEETVVKAALKQRYLNMIIMSVTEDSRICRNLEGVPDQGQ